MDSSAPLDVAQSALSMDTALTIDHAIDPNTELVVTTHTGERFSITCSDLGLIVTAERDRHDRVPARILAAPSDRMRQLLLRAF